MRWLMWIPVAFGCGTEQEPATWAFDVTVSNKADDCIDANTDVEDKYQEDIELEKLCSCEDLGGTDCSDDIDQTSNKYSYEVYMDGDNISIEIDGQPFASGTVNGCRIEYGSPGWLHESSEGEVQWAVQSLYMQADGTGTCEFGHDYDMLGVEEVEIVSSEDVNYPVGRKVRYVVTGTSRDIEE
jgi:hypothetical protein